MLPPIASLRRMLESVLENKYEQGHDTEGMTAELEALPNSYDSLAQFAEKAANLPMRSDWAYVEPNGIEDIWAECAADRPVAPVTKVEPDSVRDKIETAFLASVCGCILGKPLEINPTLEQIRRAAEAIGEWPLNDYISEAMGDHLERLHGSWTETVRERIAYAAPDDDINYTILGMLVLERHGKDFTKKELMDLWLEQLPVSTTFGPERTLLLKAGINSMDANSSPDFEQWVNLWNPRDEFCGAVIRADAYGYAFPGDPALAAAMAWRDASWTHRRTGIYATMFLAAVMAMAPVSQEPLEMFDIGLKFVPQKSRFFKIATDSLKQVRESKDFLDGYQRIHERYKEYSHCRVYQEIGTLMNTMKYAENVHDGFCKQVSQGNDTDSFGASAGSILGLFFGSEHFDRRWLEPFNDEIRTALAWFFEHSLTALAKRMSQLPTTVR